MDVIFTNSKFFGTMWRKQSAFSTKLQAKSVSHEHQVKFEDKVRRILMLQDDTRMRISYRCRKDAYPYVGLPFQSVLLSAFFACSIIGS